MSLKLAVLLVVVALAGQGLAWPRTGVVETERVPESAVSLFLGHHQFSVIDGVKKCVGTSVQIMRELGNQVTLYGRAQWARLALVGSVSKCFFQTEAATVHACGLAAFTKYMEEGKKIEDARIASKQKLSELMKALPKCLQEDPAPTPTPTQPPTTQPPTTQPPTTQPPTTQPPTTQPPTTQPPTTQPPPSQPPTTQPPPTQPPANTTPPN